VTVDGVTVRAFGGREATGPGAVVRRKTGTMHALRVDHYGAPLAIRTAGTNARNHEQILPVELYFPEPGAGLAGQISCPTS
jgi:hypothetical protein